MQRTSFDTLLTSVPCICAALIARVAVHREFARPAPGVVERTTSIDDRPSFAHGQVAARGAGPVTLVVLVQGAIPLEELRATIARHARQKVRHASR